MWDVTEGSAPPWLAGCARRPYDLLVDKGTLDVLLYTGPERVVAYCAALHACLLPSDEPGWLAPLFVHYSDDESRSELLDAAFRPKPAGGSLARTLMIRTRIGKR